MSKDSIILQSTLLFFSNRSTKALDRWMFWTGLFATISALKANLELSLASRYDYKLNTCFLCWKLEYQRNVHKNFRNGRSCFGGNLIAGARKIQGHAQQGLASAMEWKKCTIYDHGGTQWMSGSCWRNLGKTIAAAFEGQCLHAGIQNGEVDSSGLCEQWMFIRNSQTLLPRCFTL